MEEFLVEGSLDLESVKSLWELDGFFRVEWNFCLEDFRKVFFRVLKGLMENGFGLVGCWCFCFELREGFSRVYFFLEVKKRNFRVWRRLFFGLFFFVSGI